MNEVRSLQDYCSRTLARLRVASERSKELKVVQGQMSARTVHDVNELQAELEAFSAAGGWQQYQSAIVRPADPSASQPLAQHSRHGTLLDAELYTAEGRSMTIRHFGEGWQLSWWQPGQGEGEDRGEFWLADELSLRSLGGGHQRYLRLWSLDDGEQPTRQLAAWLMGSVEQHEERS